jgi:hypothetical protein
MLYHSLVFRWLAIPWIQAELDSWVIQRNQTAPRHDKNKILPHGIPELIRLHPERYGYLDFRVCHPQNAVNFLTCARSLFHHRYLTKLRQSMPRATTLFSNSYRHYLNSAQKSYTLKSGHHLCHPTRSGLHTSNSFRSSGTR